MACVVFRQALLWPKHVKGRAAIGMGTVYLKPENSVCYKNLENTHSRSFTSSSRPSRHIDPVFSKLHLKCGVKTTSRPISITKVNFNTSNGIEESQLKKEMETITDQFIEAKEMMEDARESKGTVYFSEDVEDAQNAVKETLETYQKLLGKISPSQKQQVLRTIGLKMEELKAQLNAMEEDLKEDH